MSTKTTILSLAVAVASLGWIATAHAQSGGYNLDAGATPPGYDRPDAQTVVAERELVQPFNSSPITRSDTYDAPLNEFAGQRYKTDPGLIGGALGNVKRSIFGGRAPKY